jgi:hypothetical protein
MIINKAKEFYRKFSRLYNKKNYEKAFNLFNKHPEIKKYFDWGEKMKMQRMKKNYDILKDISNDYFFEINLLIGQLKKIEPIKSAIQYGWEHRN